MATNRPMTTGGSMTRPARRGRRLGITIVALAGACLLPRAGAAAGTPAPPQVREPAVAGLFYPKDPAELSRMIDALLAAAKVEPAAGELRALICPHAGYPYSGPVAAHAFRLLAGREYQTVVVMGPAHYAELRAAAVTDAAVWRTPLGDVPISDKARRLGQLAPFALNPRCRVQRPDWYRQASRPAPEVDTAETWEHSVEVEVPFLQRTLKRFDLIPVVCGEFDEQRAAKALLQILDDRTLLVASSDLSHYYSSAMARNLDRHTVEAICRLDPDAIGDGDACGHTPIRTLLYVAKERGWQARLLDARNSGDTAGDQARVVGYAAIAFYAPAQPARANTESAPAAGPHFTTADRRFLLGLARRTLRAVTAGGQLPGLPAATLDPKFIAAAGCFVTLTKHRDLRGCIGYITPEGPLYQAVIDNARNAALRDQRFPPVTPREVDQLEIEISVLTVPLPLFFSSPEDLLRKLHPGVDGVVLRIGGRSATYLPQVWEQIPDRADFLNNLAEKAGCEPSAWRQSNVSVLVYHVESFKESDKETTDAH
jgi:hypothetical protein